MESKAFLFAAVRAHIPFYIKIKMRTNDKENTKFHVRLLTSALSTTKQKFTLATIQHTNLFTLTTVTIATKRNKILFSIPDVSYEKIEIPSDTYTQTRICSAGLTTKEDRSIYRQNKTSRRSRVYSESVKLYHKCNLYPCSEN